MRVVAVGSAGASWAGRRLVVGCVASGSGMTSTIATVTLSGAPPSRVRSIRVRQIRSRSSPSARAARISSSGTTPESPSEHSSHRSPGTASTRSSSSSGEASVSPRTRMTTFL